MPRRVLPPLVIRKPLVICAEPAGADDAYRSKKARKLIPQTGPNTFCDGLLTSVGDNVWPILRDLVHSVVRAFPRFFSLRYVTFFTRCTTRVNIGLCWITHSSFYATDTM